MAMKRREAKGKGEKERCTHLNAEFQRVARRVKKASLRKEMQKRQKKRSERQRRKGNIYTSECRVPENSKER